MTILIVDDNSTVRRLIRQALSETARSVVECADGADAIEVYAKCLPDLVLMDIRMHRVDGLTATRLLTKRFPQAKVLMLTDYDEDDLRAAAKEAGACGYALKHNLTSLEALVEKMCREKGDARPE